MQPGNDERMNDEWLKPGIHGSRSAFMRWALLKILSTPNHRLRFLLSLKENAKGALIRDRRGKPKLYWNQITRVTKSGRVQRGRYPIPEDLVSSNHSDDKKKVIVQAGHMLARSSRGDERLMLEDVELNIIGGQTIESRGAVSAKRAVLVGGIPVDWESAKRWASLGLLPLPKEGMESKRITFIEPPSF